MVRIKTSIVLDDFSPLGRAWRETDEAGGNRAMLVRNLLDGQYESPVRIDPKPLKPVMLISAFDDLVDRILSEVSQFLRLPH